MKLKHCFTLTVILIILFSIATVAASENMTSSTPASDDSLAVYVNSQNSVESVKNENIIESSNNEISSSEDVNDDIDLYVEIGFKNVFQGNKFNSAGFEIPFNITAQVSGGTAHNVKVLVKIPKTMEYISSDPTVGAFDPSSGVWDIGDLISSSNATLNMLTKLKVDGIHMVTVDATTTSHDIDSSNNFNKLPISNGTVGDSSNTTETSDDKKGGDHNKKQQSQGGGTTERHRNENHQEDPINEDPVKPMDDPQNGGNGKHDFTHQGASGSEDGAASNPKTKTVLTGSNENLLTKTTSSVMDSLSNSISNIVNPATRSNNESSELNITNDVIKAIPAYDYTRIPILIFTAFIILLLGILAYDKVKS